MLLSDSLRTAARGIRHARMRSFLTMLGIVIGIASVILLMSIGASAEKLILDQVRSVGSNLIFVIPGGSGGSRFSSPASVQGIIIKTLVEDDVRALEREPSITAASPDVRGQARAIYENNDKTVTFIGVPANFFPVRNFKTDKGYPFTATDVASFNRVAVIGPTIAKDLFGERDPIGKLVRLKDVSFRVVGVLESKGVGPLGVDQDNIFLLPITVAQKQLLGINYYNFLTIQADEDYDIKFTQARATSILRQNHKITDPVKDDFTIRTQQDSLELLGNITGVMTIFLTSIAFISLVVGGIGIMNIMLVSVIERTKEIGLRKAVGATNTDILQQFLWESVMLTVIGGATGIAIGAGLVSVIYLVVSNFFESAWSFALPPSAIGLAVLVSSLTGIVFGIYPARQAGKKDPIEALRYE